MIDVFFVVLEYTKWDIKTLNVNVSEMFFQVFVVGARDAAKGL